MAESNKPENKSPGKVWKASDEAKAGMEVTSNSASMVGDKKNFIHVNKLGATIHGKMSLLAPADEIRVAGLFTFQNHYKGIVPSTLASPVPQYEIAPPVTGISDIVKSLAFLKSLLV